MAVTILMVLLAYFMGWSILVGVAALPIYLIEKYLNRIELAADQASGTPASEILWAQYNKINNIRLWIIIIVLALFFPTAIIMAITFWQNHQEMLAFEAEEKAKALT